METEASLRTLMGEEAFEAAFATGREADPHELEQEAIATARGWATTLTNTK